MHSSSSIAALALALMSATNVAGAAFPTSNNCPELQVVYARGTTETDSLGVLGQPLKATLQQKLGPQNVKMDGIPAPTYPATVPDFLVGGSKTGSAAMAKMAGDEVAQCPNSTVAIVGYSQGGQIVHNAADQLPGSTTKDMVAVIFGDPKNGTAVAGISPENTLIICHQGDNICEHGNIVKAEHLSYGPDVATAADFLIARMRAHQNN